VIITSLLGFQVLVSEKKNVGELVKVRQALLQERLISLVRLTAYTFFLLIYLLTYLLRGSTVLERPHLAGLLGRVISPSQGLYLQDSTTQKDADKHHALSGIRTHDPRVRAIKAHTSDRAARVTDFELPSLLLNS
jgi:hypothetical protein